MGAAYPDCTECGGRGSVPFDATLPEPVRSSALRPCGSCSSRKWADELKARAARVKAGEAIELGSLEATWSDHRSEWSIYAPGGWLLTLRRDDAGWTLLDNDDEGFRIDDLDSFATLLRTLREIAGAM